MNVTVPKSTEGPALVILSEAKDLAAGRDRPFASPSRSLPLSEAKGSGLRLTQGDTVRLFKRSSLTEHMSNLA